MNSSVDPLNGAKRPERAAVSSVRTLVVPTATVRPPAALLVSIAATAEGPIGSHSLCIGCSAIVSVAMGRNVSSPTCSVTRAIATPWASMRRSSSPVKCSPAVGAATAPGTWANTVW